MHKSRNILWASRVSGNIPRGFTLATPISIRNDFSLACAITKLTDRAHPLPYQQNYLLTSAASVRGCITQSVKRCVVIGCAMWSVRRFMIRCLLRCVKQCVMRCVMQFCNTMSDTICYAMCDTTCDAGLGPMYSVLWYFGTRVLILQYSSVLGTLTFKKYLYSYLYSSTFKNKSTFNEYLRVLYEY